MDSLRATTAMVAPRSVASGSASSRSAVSLSLLNGFELTVDGCRAQVPLASQRVLAFLVLHRRRVARLFVAGHLWIDSDEPRAAAALRTALWRLGPCGPALVRSDGLQLSIDPRVVIDVDVAARTARDVLDGVDPPLPATALDTLRGAGELLADWYDDWVIFERERFRQLRLHALEELCARLSADGRYALATDAGLAAVAGEPLRESAHRALIAAHLREANHGEALRQYQAFRDLLRRDLGIAPSEQIERMVAHLTQHVTPR